jgi:F420-dependent oxidoreductase-like protein
MKIGLQIPRFDWPGNPHNIGAKLAEIAKTAEAAGLSSLWVMDHFFQIGSGYGPPEAPMLEGYSVMSFLAAVTQRIKVGLLVTGNVYRHPGILIKTVTTLDVLSKGRAYLGIGTGWYEAEAKGLGVPFPPTWKERFGRLEETLQIAHHMWRGDTSPFVGEYYQLDKPLSSPPPLSRPHPPILVGGDGETKTMRLVAQYGDVCNWRLGSPLQQFTERHRDLYRTRRERLARKLNKLREHCEAVGRPYMDIERSVHGPVKLAPNAMSATELVELCHELADAGFDHYMFNIPNVHEITPLEILGRDVIPLVTKLGG